MTYYAIGNVHGFMNTEFVRMFDPKKARDDWAATHKDAVRPCSRKGAIAAIIGNYTCVWRKAPTIAQAIQEIKDMEDLRRFDEKSRG